MFTIRRAAALTGVPEATLRAWERRYAVVVPGRTDSGYRIYQESDIETILEMQALVSAGWAPRQAAQQVRGESAQLRGKRGGNARRRTADRLL